MPWAHRKRLPETDALLYHAHSVYKGNLCGCGCGQWAPEAHDPLMTGHYEIDDSIVCNAGAALQEWQKSDSEHAEPGTIPVVRKADEMAAEQLERLEVERDRRRANAARKPAQSRGEGGIA